MQVSESSSAQWAYLVDGDYMGSFFSGVLFVLACVCVVFAAIFAIGFVFVHGKRRAMAGNLLRAGCMAAFFWLASGHGWQSAASADSRSTTTAGPVHSGNDKSSYDPSAILGHAEQAYKDKHYEIAEELLMQLHMNDLNQPKPHALLNKVSRLAEHQRSAQEASDRADFAKDYESALLSAGIDATVRAQGAGNKTLYLSTPLMSRPLVYQILNPEEHAKSDLEEGNVWRAMTDDRSNLPALWRSKGFERVIFTDGSDNTWAYKLD